MPQGPTYIFSLTDKDYNFWQENSNGDIVLSTNPYFLDFSPSGWPDISIQVIRERVLWATNRAVTVPLTYIKDGGHIVKHVAYTKGYEQPLYLSIGVRRTVYNPNPKGTVSILNLAQGPNSGIVTGPVNTTVFVKVKIAPGQGTISGNVGSEYINLYAGQEYIVHVQLNATGIANYNLTLTTLSGPTVTATTEISNANGTTQGGYGYYYKKIYRGEINLVDFVHNNSKVTCTTVEDGLPKHFKANQKTVYDLSFDVDEAILLKFDGIDLFNTVNYGTPGVDELSSGIVGGYKLGTFALTLLTQEGDGYGLSYLSSAGISGGSVFDDIAPFVASTDQFVVVNTGTIPITLEWTGRKKIHIISNPQGGLNGDPTINIGLFKSTNEPNWIVVGANPPEGSDQIYNYQFTITLNPGEKIVPIRYFGGDPDESSGVATAFSFDEDASFDKIKVTTRRPTTFVKHLPINYVYKKLIELTTQNEYTSAVSSFLNLHSNKALTCGNAIRGFDDAVLSISLDMLFKFFDSIDSVGIKELLNKTVALDKKENLIDYSNVIHLGKPTYGSVKISFAKEYMYNEVEIGYKEIKADIGALNGKEDLFCKYLYSLGTVKQPAKIDKVSPLKATPWEQEKIRTTVIEKITSDYKSDNDVFVNVFDTNLVAAIDPGTDPAFPNGQPAHYILDRTLNQFITTGITAYNSVWNMSISPGRMVETNLSYLLSCSYEMDQFVLDFKNADRNSSVVCNGLVEKTSYILGNIPNRFFKPIYIEAEWPVPDNILELLDIDPVQVFDFEIGPYTFIGILNKIEVAHATRKTQNLQFIAAPVNDFTKLIKFIG